MATSAEQVLADLQQTTDVDKEAWISVLELCGDELNEWFGPPPDENDSLAKRVAARSYTLRQAAQLAGVKAPTLRKAARELALDSFLDPQGVLRFPVYTFRPVAEDADLCEMIAGYERVRPPDLRSILGLDSSRLRQQLQQAGIQSKHFIWRDIRGLWVCRRPT